MNVLFSSLVLLSPIALLMGGSLLGLGIVNKIQVWRMAGGREAVSKTALVLLAALLVFCAVASALGTIFLVLFESVSMSSGSFISLNLVPFGCLVLALCYGALMVGGAVFLWERKARTPVGPFAKRGAAAVVMAMGLVVVVGGWLATMDQSQDVPVPVPVPAVVTEFEEDDF